MLSNHDFSKFLFQIMLETAKRPNVLDCCLATGRLQEFQGLGYGLERCQKSLNDYLDSKRRRFPRFYFISTDELLSILGSSDPNCVQEHMIKVRIFFLYIITVKGLPFLYHLFKNVFNAVSSENFNNEFSI